MKNKYEIRGDVTVIFVESPKYGHFEIFISTIDLKKLIKFENSWSIRRNNSGDFYAISHSKRDGNRQKTILMHRFITDADKNKVVDHINHNTLDNKRSNLRLATPSQNSQNRLGATVKSKTGIRGVTFYAPTRKWKASAQVGGKNKSIGYFDEIGEAKMAAEKYREKYMKFSKEALKNG